MRKQAYDPFLPIDISESSEWKESSCQIDVTGIRPLYLHYKGKEKRDLLEITFQ